MILRRFHYPLRAGSLFLAVFYCAIAHAGLVYVSSDNGTIEKYDSQTGADLGAFVTGLTYPLGLAFDSAGNLYVANPVSSTVSKISPAGNISTFATLPPGSNPVDLAFDKSGNLYVSQLETSRISKISPSGSITTFASGGLINRPDGIAFDSSGNLYVANFDDFRISKVTPSGAVSQFAFGGANGLIVTPDDVAVAANGDVFVTNNSRNTISKITSTGVASLFASGGGLSGPDGLAIAPNGELFVANHNGNTISRVSSTGTVTLFATTAGAPNFIAFAPVIIPEPSSTLIGFAVAAVSLFGRRRGKLGRGCGRNSGAHSRLSSGRSRKMGHSGNCNPTAL
jgi:DNA-binding beta-propeller fold protein YncE